MNRRIKILIMLVFLLGFCVVGRLFELQVLGHNFLGETIYRRQITKKIIPAERGKIFTHDGKDFYSVAINVNTYNLIASPNEVSQSKITPAQWLGKIVSYLDISEPTSVSEEVFLIQENEETNKLKNVLIRISSKNDYYELLKKGLTTKEMEEIQDLNLPGISFETVPRRYYPEENVFSHLIGFVNLPQDCEQGICQGGTGQYGLEKFFDKELAGQSGWQNIENSGGLPDYTKDTIKPAKKGIDLVLTIDRTIQFFTCQLLGKAIKEYEATEGSIVVLEIKTGRILALCNKPDFNPNNYSEVKNYSLFKNPVVNSSFEPGSIFKVITMASGLDSGVVIPETTFLDLGMIDIDGDVIHNVDDRSFGYQDMTGILEKSINTGAVFVAQKLGRPNFRNYLKKFGFGSLTKIELPDEMIGDISNLDQKQKIYLATASFGQGITVTPIQMVNAIAAIANKGKLMKPYLIEAIIKDGQKIIQEPEFIRQVISPSVASSLTAMMVSVCEKGYGKGAQVKDYYVAGKTGTAQIPQKGGGYSDETIHSFVGFAPATDPKFAVLIKFDKPQKGRFAESTAVPVFAQLTEFILDYYHIPPDKKH